MAAFHAAAADAAPDAAAERIEATMAPAGLLGVRLGRGQRGAAAVAFRAYFDLLEELSADECLVGGVGLQTHWSRWRMNGRPGRLSWWPQTL